MRNTGRPCVGRCKAFSDLVEATWRHLLKLRTQPLEVKTRFVYLYIKEEDDDNELAWGRGKHELFWKTGIKHLNDRFCLLV